MFDDIGNRSREIFRHLVEAYMETGEPIGSRTLSQRLGMNLSPASIRNIMGSLEQKGLLYSPHTSAGRLPTEAGLRFFVHGLMELGYLSDEEKKNIDKQCKATGNNMPQMLEDASLILSGLSKCAGLVMGYKSEKALKHIEFVNLGPGRALLVLLTEDGLVENRVLELPLGMPHSSLTQATNYLNARLKGQTLPEVKESILEELKQDRAELDEVTRGLVEAGIASWSGSGAGETLIVRGKGNLLQDIHFEGDLERLKGLFDILETKESLISILDSSMDAEGVQIFIGSENTLFDMSGCSMIVAPYGNNQNQVVGAVGVIGPKRINYGKIIP
ncbi:MAG: heat-inducible transcriptional repressor HrcA, partial [Alphaproteobacteria bacterium]|nr:heat-inducible transcriptional repressor HrcA [Alphaproteobacteria bacterium]